MAKGRTRARDGDRGTVKQRTGCKVGSCEVHCGGRTGRKSTVVRRSRESSGQTAVRERGKCKEWREMNVMKRGARALKEHNLLLRRKARPRKHAQGAGVHFKCICCILGRRAEFLRHQASSIKHQARVWMSGHAQKLHPRLTAPLYITLTRFYHSLCTDLIG